MAPIIQFELFTHPGPLVARYRSTNAHRSTLLQYDSGDVQLTTQLPDQNVTAGRIASTAVGREPVSWLL